MPNALFVEMAVFLMVVAGMCMLPVMFKRRGVPMLHAADAGDSVRIESSGLLTVEVEQRPQPVFVPESEPEIHDYMRLRKEILSQDPKIRFSVLKDWLSINMLAIFRRACRGW